MSIGSASVRTRDQELALELDVLSTAGRTTLFQEKFSGAKDELERAQVLGQLQPTQSVSLSFQGGTGQNPTAGLANRLSSRIPAGGLKYGFPFYTLFNKFWSATIYS